METVYHKSAKQTGNWDVLKPATELLQEVLGPFQSQIQAEWENKEDERGQPLYTLKIKDDAGEEAEARFALDELANKTHMRIRLHQIWGNLLQAQNHKLLQQLHEVDRLEN